MGTSRRRRETQPGSTPTAQTHARVDQPKSVESGVCRFAAIAADRVGRDQAIIVAAGNDRFECKAGVPLVAGQIVELCIERERGNVIALLRGLQDRSEMTDRETVRERVSAFVDDLHAVAQAIVRRTVGTNTDVKAVVVIICGNRGRALVEGENMAPSLSL